MPMVEGIGDEVLQVFGICIIILIFVTAWKSTAIRELPQIRAVFILDRRSQTVFTNDVSTMPAPAAPPDPGQNTNNSTVSNNASNNQRPHIESTDNNEDCKPASSHNEVNALRLSYFSNLQNQNHVPSTSSGLTDSEETAQTTTDTQNECEVEGTVDAEVSEHCIRVKLKYLSDEQRIVRGNLKELLGQFKRRYFEMELSNNKNVLLIFQGRVLKEEETLESLGMYDNCVVHCLIKNGRAPDTDSRSTSLHSHNTPADWNLGPLLLATLVAMFALAWFSFWTYPQLFGITSTILLACLTTIFILAVASLYYPRFFQSL